MLFVGVCVYVCVQVPNVRRILDDPRANYTFLAPINKVHTHIHTHTHTHSRVPPTACEGVRMRCTPASHTARYVHIQLSTQLARSMHRVIVSGAFA